LRGKYRIRKVSISYDSLCKFSFERCYKVIRLLSNFLGKNLIGKCFRILLDRDFASDKRSINAKFLKLKIDLNCPEQKKDNI